MKKSIFSIIPLFSISNSSSSSSKCLLPLLHSPRVITRSEQMKITTTSTTWWLQLSRKYLKCLNNPLRLSYHNKQALLTLSAQILCPKWALLHLQFHILIIATQFLIIRFLPLVAWVWCSSNQVQLSHNNLRISWCHQWPQIITHLP